MTSPRKLALALTLASIAAVPAVAGSAGRYDGNWSLSVVTEKGSCDAYRWTIVVSGNQLQRINELPVDASGAIDSRGQASFLVASVVKASGQMREASGSGTWDAPSKACSGRWQAARL